MRLIISLLTATFILQSQATFAQGDAPSVRKPISQLIQLSLVQLKDCRSRMEKIKTLQKQGNSVEEIKKLSQKKFTPFRTPASHAKKRRNKRKLRLIQKQYRECRSQLEEIRKSH